MELVDLMEIISIKKLWLDGNYKIEIIYKNWN